MNIKEKLCVLQKLDEKNLKNDILIPLFRYMGYKDVIDNHGGVEKGKDIIFYEENKIDEREYIAVQAKAVKIHGAVGKKGNASEILAQAQQAFTTPFLDIYDGIQKRVDKVFIVSSNNIDSSAKDSICCTLDSSNIYKKIIFIDGSKLVNLIDKHMPSVFWNEYDYFNKYFNAMKNDFEKIKDISAIGQKEPVSLEDIYVSLRICEKTGDTPIPFIPQQKIFDEKLLRHKISRTTKKEKILDAERAVKEHNRIVIVGTPGAGKSTLLKHLALKSCKENLVNQEVSCIPVPITLSQFSESTKDLREYIDEVFEKFDFPRAKDFVEACLKDGKCRLLLDGFDELATVKIQKEVTSHIRKFIVKYSKSRVIVTSRIAGYHDELKGFTKLEIMEFDDKQMEKFIDNWFNKTNPSKAKSMFKAIQMNSQIKELACNPLMIAIIAIIYEEDRELPQKRADLYKRCVDVLLERWDAQRKLKNRYHSEKKEFILRKLAFHAHSNNNRIMTEKEVIDIIDKHRSRLHMKKEEIHPFLDEIWQRSYILRQISMNSYDFLHLSFQEYFTALELKERRDGISTIVKHLSEPWWEEPILLYAGICKDATYIIKRVKKEPEDIFCSNLMLFGKCVASADFTEPSLREEIVNELWSLYQTGEFKLLRERAKEVLSLIRPHSIVNSLIKNLKDKKIDVRWRAADSLGDIGIGNAVKPLINVLKNDEDSDVRWSAARALGNIGNVDAVEPLIYALKTDESTDVRWSAASALGVIGSDIAVESLIDVIKDEENIDILDSAAKALSDIDTTIAIDSLINALKNGNCGVRRTVCIAIGNFGRNSAIEPLIYILKNDEDCIVRANAATSLGNIGSDVALGVLLDALKKKYGDFIVPECATQALGNLGDDAALDPLIHALNDVVDVVQASAAAALGNLGNDAVLNLLINALNDGDHFVRASAAQALGNLGNERAIEPLIMLLEDYRTFSSERLKDAAFSSLEKISKRINKRIIPESV